MLSQPCRIRLRLPLRPQLGIGARPKPNVGIIQPGCELSDLLAVSCEHLTRFGIGWFPIHVEKSCSAHTRSVLDAEVVLDQLSGVKESKPLRIPDELFVLALP